MSVKNIIGNTNDESDARRVPWANLVCNSIYALNSKTKNIDAIDGNINHLTVEDITGQQATFDTVSAQTGNIDNLTVQTINSFPPTIIGMQKYTTNVAPHTHNVGDQVYNMPLNTLQYTEGVIGSQYSGTPGTINILITGVYLVNFQFQMMYIGTPRTSTITYTARLRIGASTTRYITTVPLWSDTPGYIQGTAILDLNAGDTVRLQVPSISVGQSGPIELSFTAESEFSIVKLL